MTVLYKKELEDFPPWSSGSTPLLTDQEHNGRKLIVSVKCSFGDNPERYYALFDTGAEWSVIPQSMVEDNPENFFSLGERITMSTRFGLIEGVLHGCTLHILVDTGKDITIDTTLLVIPDWPGPVVLGFNALLSNIRWACDPTVANEGRLYFGLNL